MRNSILFLGLLLASIAHADVSDSGNLTIGGQGVVAGSMTVQGPGGLGVTYGVATSTLTASSATLTATGSSVYTLTSSSGIHVLNGEIRLEQGAYIRWPDMRTSTTSSSGTGSNNFTSTVTVGPSVYTTTANYAAILNNSPSLVVSTNIVGVTAVTITNILSSMTYTLLVEGAKNTSAGDLGVRFNNDSTNDFAHVAHCDNAVTANAPSSTADSAILFDETNNQIAAGGVFGLTFDFRSDRKDTRKILGHFEFRADAVAGTLSHCEGVGAYHGSLQVTSMTVMTNGGTIDATILLYAYPVQSGSSQ
jgi:hypothetical protein